MPELFPPFAYVTILGEIRRYFRRHSHTIRPPRAMAELSSRAAVAVLQLEQRLGRHAHHAAVAAAIGVGVQELDSARTAGQQVPRRQPG